MPPKGRIQIKLRVPEKIVALIHGCHPRLKRKIRSGLRHIMAEPEFGKWLKDELAGMQSYRISTFRIIYRRSSPRIIDIVAIGPRKTIYEKTYRIIKKESHQQRWINWLKIWRFGNVFPANSLPLLLQHLKCGCLLRGVCLTEAWMILWPQPIHSALCLTCWNLHMSLLLLV